MKKIIVLLALISSVGYAQKQKTSPQPIPDTLVTVVSNGDIVITLHRKDIVRYGDTLIFVKDSLNSIKILFQTLKNVNVQATELSRKHIELADQYNALYEIMACINEKGLVMDKKRFDQAVLRYKKLNEPKK